MTTAHYVAGAFALSGLLGMFIILGIIGTMDYEDAKNEEAFYTQMVCEGTWPDYKNLSPVCDAQ